MAPIDDNDYLQTMLSSLTGAGKTLQGYQQQRIESDRNAALNKETDLQAKLLQQKLDEEADKKTKAEMYNKQFQDMIGKVQGAQNNIQTAKDLGQIQIGDNGGDSQPQTPMAGEPLQDLAAQADQKYPSLGGLAGKSVMGKTNITEQQAIDAGYSPMPGQAVAAEPIAGSPSEASLNQGNQDLKEGQAMVGKSRTDLYNGLGGLQFQANPYTSEAASKIGQQLYDQDKADETAKTATSNAATKADWEKSSQAAEERWHNENNATQLKIAEMNNATKSANAGSRLQGASRGAAATIMSRLNSDKNFQKQDMNVSSSIHGLGLLDQMQKPDGSYDITAPQSAELAMIMANLAGSGTSHTLEEYRAMNQSGLQKSMLDAYNRMTGSNLNVLPPNWANLYRESIGRQGAISQMLRDKAIDPVVNMITAGSTTPEQKEIISENIHKWKNNVSDLYPEFEAYTNGSMPKGDGAKVAEGGAAAPANTDTGAAAILAEIRKQRGAK